MRTIIDKTTVRKRMADLDIDSFSDLAVMAQIAPSTLYRMLDGEGFRSVSLDALAIALQLRPIHLLKETDTDNGHQPTHDCNNSPSQL